MLTHAETSGTLAPVPPGVEGGDGHAEIDGEFVDGEESGGSFLVFDSQLVSFLTSRRPASASWSAAVPDLPLDMRIRIDIAVHPFTTMSSALSTALLGPKSASMH